MYKGNRGKDGKGKVDEERRALLATSTDKERTDTDRR